MKPLPLGYHRIVFLLLPWVCNLTRAQVLWNEGSQGDLSNNQSAPSNFTLATGVNTVIGTAGTGDSQDWMHFNIPAGLQLTAVTPRTFVSSDTTAFTGVQAGSAFVGSVSDPAAYLGYTHLSLAVVDANILPAMGTAAGVTGFTPPLPAGDYTFLIQQLGTSLSYQVDYTIAPVPEPRTEAAVAGALCGLYFIRRRLISRREGGG